jgi:hypothetical protein
MQPQSFHFDTLPYVPRRFWFGGFFLFVAFLGLVTATYWLIAFGFLVSIVCLTTFYKVEVNPTEKWFKEYTWVLGLKMGERVHYQTIDYLFINVGKVTETTHSRIQSGTFVRHEFRGFAKFDGKEKIHIITSSDHKQIQSELDKIARILNTRVVDYTDSAST